MAGQNFVLVEVASGMKGASWSLVMFLAAAIVIPCAANAAPVVIGPLPLALPLPFAPPRPVPLGLSKAGQYAPGNCFKYSSFPMPLMTDGCAKGCMESPILEQAPVCIHVKHTLWLMSSSLITTLCGGGAWVF